MKKLVYLLLVSLFISCGDISNRNSVKENSLENSLIISEMQLDSLLDETSESIKLYSESLSDSVESIDVRPIADSLYIDENNEIIGNFVYLVKQLNKNKKIREYRIHVENYGISLTVPNIKNWHKIRDEKFYKFENQ